MDIRAKHLTADIWLKHTLDSTHVQAVCDVIERRLEVVRKERHRFEPYGETILFILAESHFALHTYPENNYLSLDIYVCNLSVDLGSVLEEIKALLPVEDCVMQENIRGVRPRRWGSVQAGFFDQLLGQRASILGATVVAAFCSIIYELLLAQTLSTFLGDTALRYNLTIGLYIASMGVGALLYQRLVKAGPEVTLAKLELLISMVGLSAPWLALMWEHMGRAWFGPMSPMLMLLFNGFYYLLIVGLGFLTGLELPMLMELGRRKQAGLENQVLAVDYLGTLLGAVAFPLFLVPHFNLLSMGVVVALLNVLVGGYLMLYLRQRTFRDWLLFGVLLILCLGMIMNQEALMEWGVHTLYLGG